MARLVHTSHLSYLCIGHGGSRGFHKVEGVFDGRSEEAFGTERFFKVQYRENSKKLGTTGSSKLTKAG